MSSSAAPHGFGNCLPRLFSKIFFPGFLLFCRTLAEASSAEPALVQDLCYLMYTSTTVLPLLGGKLVSGKCLDRQGRNEDTMGIAFFQIPVINLFLISSVVMAMIFPED